MRASRALPRSEESAPIAVLSGLRRLKREGSDKSSLRSRWKVSSQLEAACGSPLDVRLWG